MDITLILLIISVMWFLFNGMPKILKTNAYDRKHKYDGAITNQKIQIAEEKYDDLELARMIVRLEEDNKYDELWGMCEAPIEEIKRFGPVHMTEDSFLFHMFCQIIIMGYHQKVQPQNIVYGFDFSSYEKQRDIETIHSIMLWLNSKMMDTGLEEMMFIPYKYYRVNTELQGPPVKISEVTELKRGQYFWKSTASPYLINCIYK